MKKISVTGPSIKDLMSIFSDFLVTGFRLPLMKFKSIKKSDVVFEVVIEKIDASIWSLPESHFENEPTEKKRLIIDGWINSEKCEKYHSTVERKCRIEIFADGSISLQKKKTGL